MTEVQSLYERVGGIDTLNKVHETFYTKIFADPWLSKYFTIRPREHQVKQQTTFFTQLMGGPKRYMGKPPLDAHQFMMITEELFELRTNLLTESLIEHDIADNLRQEWIALNDMFKRVIVKKSLEECKLQYSHQELLNFPKNA